MARNQPGQRQRRIVPRTAAEIEEERRFAAWDRLMRSNRGVDLGDAGPAPDEVGRIGNDHPGSSKTRGGHR